MKNRALAIICACLMIVSLAACGENNTATSNEPVQTEAVSEAEPTPEVVTSAEAEPVEEADSTPSEEKPEEEIEETEETADAEASVQEEKEPVASDADDEVEEPVEDTKPESSQDTIVTEPILADEFREETEMVSEVPTLEPSPATDLGTTSTTNISSTFDVYDFYMSTNSTDYWIIDHQVMIVYEGVWFIELSTNTYNSNLAYISIGSWNQDLAVWNNNTYSCVMNFGEGAMVVSMYDPGYSNSVSKNALAILPALVDYMKASRRTDVAPNIPGYTFKPCQAGNPFIQY